MVKLDPKEYLRQSEERYQRMVEEVEDYAIILLDEEGIILNWNRGAERIKGYTASEIVGKSFKNFYTAVDRENRLPDTLLDEARQKGRAVHEGWRVKKDGTLFWGSIVLSALHNDAGEVIGFTKVTRDLSERKAGEDALREYTASLEKSREELKQSEDLYHRMIDEVQDYAILLLNKEGYIVNWNKGASRIKGYTSEEVIGKHFSIFYPPADIERGLPEQLLAESYQAGRVIHEGWRIRKDGTKFWGSVVITAIHNELGEIVGFTKVTRDLTERKEAEDKLIEYARILEQKNAELEQFAYVASHDIKEPLRKIIAFGDLLNNFTDKLDEKGRHYIERMQSASERMMQLIENLLEFSRVERTAAPFIAVDLNIIVADVLHDLEVNIREKKAEVSVGGLPVIMARASQMRQLFQNLISNSLKFNTNERPSISITSRIVNTTTHGETAEISVSDNGIGFSEEYKEKIFEIFQRLHGLSEYPGTGIGLAICKKIVDAHQGTISAYGIENEGATFVVMLPLIQKAEQKNNK